MRILLVQTGFLGDVILSTPLIANLRELYPTAELSFLTTKVAADLVRYHPEIAETLTFDKRGAQRGWRGLSEMASILRARNYDIVFSLHKSLRTALLLWRAGIPSRYGFKEAAGRWLYTKTCSRRDLSHEVLRNLALLRNVEREPEQCRQTISIYVPGSVEEDAQKLLGTKTSRAIIGIAPGSVWATKRWTAAGFAEVLRVLAVEGHQMVLLGGASDREVADEVVKLAGVSCLNLVGNSSLAVSAAVVKQLSVLITNDSAPLHLASAMKTPVVAIFCATIPEFGYSPWETRSIVLGVDGLECRPCGRHGGMRCPTGTHACQHGITPSVVVGAVKSLIAESAPCRNSL